MAPRREHPLEDDDLAEAVEATLARLKALREASEALERRRVVLRRMHYEHGVPKAEVARVLQNALHDRGLTLAELQDGGVSHASIMKVLRDP
jgi:membrane peptidoglycan carboxypeptidase